MIIFLIFSLLIILAQIDDLFALYCSNLTHKAPFTFGDWYTTCGKHLLFPFIKVLFSFRPIEKFIDFFSRKRGKLLGIIAALSECLS